MGCENLNTSLYIPTPAIPPTKVVDCTFSVNGKRCPVAAIYTDGVFTSCVGSCVKNRELPSKDINYPDPMHEGTGRG